MPTITANTNNELMASSDKAWAPFVCNVPVSSVALICYFLLLPITSYFISQLSYPIFSYLPMSNNRDGQNIEKACNPNKRKHILF